MRPLGSLACKNYPFDETGHVAGPALPYPWTLDLRDPVGACVPGMPRSDGMACNCAQAPFARTAPQPTPALIKAGWCGAPLAANRFDALFA